MIWYDAQLPNFFVFSSKSLWHQQIVLETLSKGLNWLTTWRDFNSNNKIQQIYCDHLWSFAITHLKHGLQKEWRTPWQLAGRDADFSVLHLFRSIYLVPIKLANTFVDFQCCHLKKNWKSPHRSFKKLCDKSLKIKKVRCTKSSSFRGERRGMWFFFWSLCLGVVNCRWK